jgi:hypothetical protein
MCKDDGPFGIRNLKEAAAIDSERFHQSSLRVFNGPVDKIGVRVDELRRQIGDERLERDPIFVCRVQGITGVEHGCQLDNYTSGHSANRR